MNRISCGLELLPFDAFAVTSGSKICCNRRRPHRTYDPVYVGASHRANFDVLGLQHGTLTFRSDDARDSTTSDSRMSYDDGGSRRYGRLGDGRCELGNRVVAILPSSLQAYSMD